MWIFFILSFFLLSSFRCRMDDDDAAAADDAFHNSDEILSQTEKQRYDGWFNNVGHPQWGAIGEQLTEQMRFVLLLLCVCRSHCFKLTFCLVSLFLYT